MRGRFSELFSVAGVTWFPRDIEDALCEVPGVLQASVIAVPNGGGNRPIACVTLRGEAVFDPARVKEQISVRVPYDLATLTIEAVASFPMTPTGKISKAQLIKRYRNVPAS